MSCRALVFFRTEVVPNTSVLRLPDAPDKGRPGIGAEFAHCDVSLTTPYACRGQGCGVR